MITSREAHLLAVHVLGKSKITINSIIKYTAPNPFKPYVGAPGVEKAFRGLELSRILRKRFTEYKKSGQEVNPAMTASQISAAVRKTLSKENISSPSAIKRKLKPNPFKGYAGIAAIYQAYNGKELKEETRKSFQKYFESKI